MSETTVSTEPVQEQVFPGEVRRAMTFDLIPPRNKTQDRFNEDDEPPAENECKSKLKIPIIRSINRYRAACREMYSTLLMAQTAGARVVLQPNKIKLIPRNDQGKIVLAVAMGDATVQKGDRTARGTGQDFLINTGKAMGYEMRTWFRTTLYPEALSFVWDSALRDVQTVWRARDPEFPTARRGYLALQGARGIAQFAYRGIGFQVSTGRPILGGTDRKTAARSRSSPDAVETPGKGPEIPGRRFLTLKWEDERRDGIGAVEFGIPRLDGGRYHVWRCLRDGAPGWKMGAVFLNERKNKLRATVSYTRAADIQEVDRARVLKVEFTDDKNAFIVLKGPDDKTTTDSLGARDIVGALEELSKRKDRLEGRRGDCGNPRRPWGYRKGFNTNQEVLSRSTLMREKRSKERNHAWMRRVVSRAVSWRCGIIYVSKMPETMFGHTYNWTHLRLCLLYKAEQNGIEVVHEDDPDAPDLEVSETE